jgi:hypothetical protein
MKEERIIRTLAKLTRTPHRIEEVGFDFVIVGSGADGAR